MLNTPQQLSVHGRHFHARKMLTKTHMRSKPECYVLFTPVHPEFVRIFKHILVAVG